jgi:hypothetical protein
MIEAAGGVSAGSATADLIESKVQLSKTLDELEHFFVRVPVRGSF